MQELFTFHLTRKANKGKVMSVGGNWKMNTLSNGAAEHTPGPWHRNIPPATKYNTVFAGRNTHIAHLNRIGLSPEEVEANCNLIAAAPEMLEAAKRTVLLIATVRNICGDKTAEWLMEQESYKLSVVAIAKAEGR